MKYTVINRDKFFVKEYGNSKYIILDKSNARQLFVNKSGKEIFDLCLINNDSDDVLAEISKRYKNIDERSLEMDVLQIINMLEIYKVIKIEYQFSKVFDVFEDKLHVKALAERDYGICSEFINKYI